MAGWRQAVALAMTEEEIDALTARAAADRPGTPGVARSDAARLSGESVVLWRGTKTWRSSSDGPALRRASAGLRRACGTR